MRIRRNHGLEHATIHMLSVKYPRTPIAGRADANGFFILGHLPTDAIAASADEAAARLRAVHGLRTPDAIHAATALESGAMGIITNDKAFLKIATNDFGVWLFGVQSSLDMNGTR